jgi:lipid-A-disaccharide synthase-like uncharacterized protein
MDKEAFYKMRKQLTVLCVAYGIVCEIASLFFIGFEWKFLLGLGLGIVTMLINFSLLRWVVVFFVENKNRGMAILLYLVRLALYGAVAVICYKLSMNALLAFAVGALGIVIGALINVKKEVNKGV